MAGDELARRGWHLTAEGRDQCVENGNRSTDTIVKNATNLDLRDIGEKWLPTDISTGRVKVDYLSGPSVLQVMKLRNISAPKDNQESQTAPRMWKITLTDGHVSVVAVCLEPLKNLTLLTPPGTKLSLEGTVDVESAYLLLTNRNARLLGGRVNSLVESWELKRKLAQQSRQGIQTEGGPPPFVPFGKKIATVEAPRRDNFKSLQASKQAKEEEDSEFQQQRQATIAEALQAKTKTFGGGQKAAVNDRDLARIVEMGFSPDMASNALRQTGGNVQEAIGGLISGAFRGGGYGGGFGGGGRGGGRVGRGGGGDRGEPRMEDDRDDSRRGGRGRRGRGDRGEEEGEDGLLSSRPSGPATLFDFLETKIPSKSENQPGSTNQRPSSSFSGSNPSRSSTQPSNTRPNTASSDSYSSRGPPQYNTSGPAQSRSQPNSASNYRGGGASQRNGFSSSRSSDSNFHSKNSDSGYRPSDQGGGGGRDSRGGGSGGGERDSRGGGSGGRDSHGGGSGVGGQQNEDFSHARRQQNLPPRLANKLGRDGGGNQQTEGPSRPGGSGRYQENSGYDNRTRYSGGGGGGGVGGDDNQGANPNPRPALQEHNSDSRGSNYAGGYNGDRQQSNFQQKPYDQQSNRGAANPNHKPRYDQQRPQQGPRNNGPARPMLQRGQTVLAKYWEDDQMYRAMVEAVADNGVTVVVTFLDYGNQEEVMISDIQLLPPRQNWSNSYPPPPPQGGPMMAGRGFHPGYGPPHMGAPPPFPGQESFGSAIPNMEFRRGGTGPANRRQQQEQIDRRRPTQNFYTPPTRKQEG
ncbi:tudor domain-containing protein 3-like [Littorina saxatilis]|uniref:tudor domain-containing protein 3-like n=1 Tax=Littorina saxatilis TaxID=31220 RepID=UPI0038B4C98E